MTTPKRNEIYEKALELWRNDQIRNGCADLAEITPEYGELLESGYVMLAQNLLMHDSDEYKEYLAKELGRNVEDIEEKPKDVLRFPIDTIMKEGCFICGSRGCGKSNLAKLIVQQALTSKVQVKVLDASLAWKDFPLPKIRVVPKVPIACKPNAIYDLSRLSVLEMREFVKAMMAKDLQVAIYLTDMGKKVPLLYVLEEVQNLIFPNTLRMLKYQEISRFITQGRNFNLSYIGITQRLSATDTNLVEISGVKYWFKLEGENNLRKARAWLPKYNVWRLRDLEVGHCYMQVGSDIDYLKLPLFKVKEVIA
jgi:Cdc6-like AAA superfamily ATPase